jgi:hypothetical protein
MPALNLDIISSSVKLVPITKLCGYVNTKYCNLDTVVRTSCLPINQRNLCLREKKREKRKKGGRKERNKERKKEKR